MNAAAVPAPFLDPGAGAQLQAWTPPRRALFLDRDGVINLNHGYVHEAAQTDWVPGIFALVTQARAAGMACVVVTNQAGIGRGYYSEAAFLAYTAWLHEQFAERGAPLLATFWCPHHPQAAQGQYKIACGCRKPEPGMLVAAIDRFGIDPGASLLLGDAPSDVAAARAAGVRGWQLPPGAPVPSLATLQELAR